MKIKFDREELKLLSVVLSNEEDRWEDIMYSSKDNTLVRNYELDRIILDDLREGFIQFVIDDQDMELSLNKRELEYIVEGLDNEIVSWKDAASTDFVQNEDLLQLNKLRDRIKNEAILQYGNSFNEMIHYDRSQSG